MDLLLDVNVAVDVCTKRPAFYKMADFVLAKCTQTGGRIWLYAGSVQTLARRAKRGASGRVKVLSWKGLTTHHYRVLRLWRNGALVMKTEACVNKRGEAYTGYVIAGQSGLNHMPITRSK